MEDIHIQRVKLFIFSQIFNRKIPALKSGDAHSEALSLKLKMCAMVRRTIGEHVFLPLYSSE